ncbi:MAG: PGF-CTERM sorting domain-containing protein [Haloferacaceae archaeon]
MTPSTHTFGQRVLVLVFVALLSLPATGAVAATPAQDAGTTTEDVQFARTTQEMRAHLAVSLEYKRAGDSARAAEHAHHPAEEYWDGVSPDIRAANATLADHLHETLLAAPDHARNDSAEEYAAFLHEDLFPKFERATMAVVGETNATFSARVTLGLLDRATDEYGEGVADNGTVVERDEYDDASAFATRAQVVYNESVRASLSEHAREEVDGAFDHVESAIAGPGSPEDVDRTVDVLAGELSGYAGIESSEGDGAAAIDRIESDLDEAVELYAEGHTDEATATVRQTYLSNFEGVEGTLIEEDPELVGNLEDAFNEELPGLMEQNASVETVRERVEQMEGNLSEAEDILAAAGEPTVDLGNTTTSTTTADPTETTTTSTPGVGVLGALLALVGALLFARR